MKTFSRLTMLFVFLGIALMLVGGTADAQDLFLEVIGSEGFEPGATAGTPLTVIFKAGDAGVGEPGIPLRITATPNIHITWPTPVPGTHRTGPGGLLEVRGELLTANVPASITAVWAISGDLTLDASVGIADAQYPFLDVIGSAGFESGATIGTELTVIFEAGHARVGESGIPLRITATPNIGITSPTPVPGTHRTGAGGILRVTGTLREANTGAYIQAEWLDGRATARFDIYIRDVPEAVFHRYSTTFRHPDVHKFFPDVLRAFKDPEIQEVLNSVVIHHFVRDPEYIRAFYPDVDEGIITLLATDNGFRTLFEDEGFQGVLQEPAEIDELVRLIEAQPPQEPGTLTIVSGDFQEGGPQTALGNPLVVLVRDQYGDALSGVDVTFRVTRGDGSLFRPTARTNRVGRAETTLTLASEPRIHQVEASVVGFPSLTQTFTAAAAAVCEIPEVPPTPRSLPTTLRIVSGNNQWGEVDEPLAQPFVVGVLDQSGKPLQGTAVTFRITAGNGRLSKTIDTTDVYGQARATLTLGAGAWHHSVTARAAGITQTQTFTAQVGGGGGWDVGLAPSISRVVSVENTLLANYPNPFNPETWIPYQLSASADVSVSIYAVDGRLVRRLDLGHQSAGVYQSRSRAAYWDGRNTFGERVASGLYFYTLTAGDFTATRKMLIRK